ncbi:putative transporter [Bordetella trematum]|nr:putative transporter [Bordetella trematum]
MRIQFAVITCFFVVGLSLGALPLFISDELGASDSIVGMVIGAQFLASLGSRVFVGRLLRSGARRCVAVSLGALALYGALLALGGQAFEGRCHCWWPRASFRAWPWAR